jgi:hypothetical protein
MRLLIVATALCSLADGASSPCYSNSGKFASSRDSGHDPERRNVALNDGVGHDNRASAESCTPRIIARLLIQT